MDTPLCVPELELANFVRGQLSAEQLQFIAAHVDECAACQDTVVAIAEQSDTFIQSIQSSSDAEGTQDNALQLGLRRLLNSFRTGELPHPHVENVTGQQLGPYVIGEQLGAGGMGNVFRATHSRLKRAVALKILPSNRWSNAAAVSRFEREMQAIGGLDHPHIVRASDAGEAQGMHYLVMELVDGLDLSRLVTRLGPLPLAEACEVVRQAALGLQHAHECGLIHRDVKPSNLMLAWERAAGISTTSKPTVKILDLGLALFDDDHLLAAHALTTVGTLMGTLDYMAPEQGIDSHSVDQRADIYGLGATLFKLVIGQAPYADPQYDTLMKKMTAMATKPAPSVGAIRSDLSPDFVQLVDQMLCRDPDDRFASAREVAEALSPFAETANLSKLLRRGLAAPEPESIQARRPAAALASDEATLQTASAPADRRKITNPTRWVAAAFSFVATAVVLFHMATDFGELTIRSDDPNATVLVKRGKETVKELQIENGAKTLRLRTGDYELEIKGDAEVSIQPPNVAIARNGKQEAEIRSTAENLEPLPDLDTLLDAGRDELAEYYEKTLVRTAEQFDEAMEKLVIARKSINSGWVEIGKKTDVDGEYELRTIMFDDTTNKATTDPRRFGLIPWWTDSLGANHAYPSPRYRKSISITQWLHDGINVAKVICDYQEDEPYKITYYLSPEHGNHPLFIQVEFRSEGTDFLRTLEIDPVWVEPTWYPRRMKFTDKHVARDRVEYVVIKAAKFFSQDSDYLTSGLVQDFSDGQADQTLNPPRTVEADGNDISQDASNGDLTRLPQGAALQNTESTRREGPRDLELEILRARNAMEAARDDYSFTKQENDAGTITSAEAKRSYNRYVHARAEYELLSSRLPNSDQPTYEGKNYEHWLNVLRTDRTPTTVLRAIAAMTQLGHEHSDEATKAILAAIRVTKFRTGDAFTALVQMDHSAVVQAVIEELETGNGRSRDFILGFLQHLTHQTFFDAEAGFQIGGAQRMRAAFKERGAELAAAVQQHQDSRRFEAATTMNLLVTLSESYDVDPKAVPGMLSRFQAFLEAKKWEDWHGHVAADQILAILAYRAPETKGLAKRLIEEQSERFNGLALASQLGKHAAPIVNELNNGFEQAARAGYLEQLIRTLGEIGPEATVAIPNLEGLVESEDTDPNLTAAARRAISDIRHATDAPPTVEADRKPELKKPQSGPR